MDNNEFQPLLLSTQELVAAYWPQVETQLQRCPMVEDMTTDGIRSAVLSGQMYVFVVKREDITGPEVELVLLCAAIPTDRLPVMNIIAVAGKNLRKHAKSFWDHFKGWCYMCGIRAIDAYVPEGMELLINKLFGMKRETIHVRLRI